MPIPFLGLIGLIGMVVIMGRRGFTELLSYAGICFFAIASTIMPFFFAATSLSDVVNVSPLAWLITPFPCFEGLLAYLDIGEDGLLIGGLILSAAIPWLLTGLFLRPKASSLAPPDEPAIVD